MYSICRDIDTALFVCIWVCWLYEEYICPLTKNIIIKIVIIIKRTTTIIIIIIIIMTHNSVILGNQFTEWWGNQRRLVTDNISKQWSPLFTANPFTTNTAVANELSYAEQNQWEPSSLIRLHYSSPVPWVHFWMQNYPSMLILWTLLSEYDS